jgi:DNA-directed RNA polymerase subunit M/transcription elongation factor TFIIS
MVNKQHCPACGFLMMAEVKDGSTTYTCVNNEHMTIGKNSNQIHMSENLLSEYRGLGNNLDLLMQYLKRP